jgi:hypothetical protein
LVLVVRLVVGHRLIPLRQTALILFLVLSPQLVAGLVLAVDLLALLLVMEVQAVVLVAISVALQMAQASPEKVLTVVNVLTLHLQKAVAAVAAQVRLAEQALPRKVVLAVRVQHPLFRDHQ